MGMVCSHTAVHFWLGSMVALASLSGWSVWWYFGLTSQCYVVRPPDCLKVKTWQYGVYVVCLTEGLHLTVWRSTPASVVLYDALTCLVSVSHSMKVCYLVPMPDWRSAPDSMKVYTCQCSVIWYLNLFGVLSNSRKVSVWRYGVIWCLHLTVWCLCQTEGLCLTLWRSVLDSMKVNTCQYEGLCLTAWCYLVPAPGCMVSVPDSMKVYARQY